MLEIAAAWPTSPPKAAADVLQVGFRLWQ